MIDFSDVTKRYGKTKAIDNLTLSIHEKKIYCLLGRNGAGKTTFMNLISGNISATSGEVSVNGEIVTTLNMPENVRYIEASKPQFNMRVSDLIKLASGIDSTFDKPFADKMIERFKINKRKKYKSLSFGMKTMVTTIISLASNDDIILLDEPVLGFDAIMRSEFYDLLSLSFSEHPRIIVVSTHIIEEIANVAEQIIIIDNGKLLINENINTIIEKAYKVTGLDNDVRLAVNGLNVLSIERIGKYTIAYVFDKRIQAINSIDITDISLQDLFIKMAGGKENE